MGCDAQLASGGTVWEGECPGKNCPREMFVGKICLLERNCPWKFAWDFPGREIYEENIREEIVWGVSGGGIRQACLGYSRGGLRRKGKLWGEI